MNKKLLTFGVLAAGIATASLFLNKENTNELREKHANFLRSHPYQKSMLLSKKERKAKGLPPNAFMEQEYLSEMDPATGKTSPVNVFKVREVLNKERAGRRVPGDGDDNSWIERGPNNVSGRVRAAIFDPNDATNETVFAGGVSGGLWKNTKISDANSIWVRVGIPENLSVSSIVVDPNDSNIFYVGTGESYVGGDVSGDGLWKSSDRGNTWTRIFGGITGDTFFQSSDDITVNAPASIQGNYISYPTTAFGTTINAIITSDIVLADGGAETPSEGCNAFANTAAMNGKIALIRRGSCNFDDKVKNAENAGAIAVIMMNNIPGDPIPMGGDDTTIMIPSLMISKENGDALENALKSGTVNVSLNPSKGTFTAVVVPGQQHINDLKIRNNAGVSEIYVAVADASYRSSNSRTILGGLTYGLYKSTDGGATWNKLNLPKGANPNDIAPNDIEIGADNKIWVSSTDSNAYRNGGGRIFSSSDGVNFEEKYLVENGVRTQIEVSRTNPNKIYLLAELSAGGSVSILETEDAFETEPSSLPLPNDADSGISASDFTRGQASYNLLLAVSPTDDNHLYVGGIDLFKSTDGGATWNQFSHWYGGFSQQEVHADQHLAAFANGDSSKMVFGNDGGIFYTSNGGEKTEARIKGLNVTQFYTVGVAPTANYTGDFFVAGAQDNGSQLFENASENGPADSREATGGDGAYSFFDQDGADKYYITNYVYNQSIVLYNYATNSEVQINREGSPNGDFINQEELDSNLNILYSNYSSGSDIKIKRYSNLLSGFIFKTDLKDELLTSAPSAMKVSPYTTTSTTLLVGTKLGDLLKVTNANGTPVWTEISGPDFVGSVSDIEYGASENEIFLTMHNYNVVSIWYSPDGGVTWQNKEGDFPDIPVKTILQNPLNLEEVIIGTELGVWKTTDFSAVSPNWTQSYNGMSNVKVMDLDLRDDNMVFAATYGRGVFSGKFKGEATASVEEVALGTKVFTAYPAVSNGEFTVFAKNTLGTSKMLIFDLNGKQVHAQDLDFSIKEKQKVSVNLNAGMYILNVLGNGNKQESARIIIK
ncbi:PA domain-containing protein [Tenacibaculum maritimum]|uniref:PA domain-containing protein n=1 Tax=Tenacibaculum maritimum TaxID=107401 RepID=UPI00388EDF51